MAAGLRPDGASPAWAGGARYFAASWPLLIAHARVLPSGGLAGGRGGQGGGAVRGSGRGVSRCVRRLVRRPGGLGWHARLRGGGRVGRRRHTTYLAVRAEE